MVVILLTFVWDLLENTRKEIFILKFPPYASHVLQPMNLSVYRPLDLKWDQEIIKCQRGKYPLAQNFQFGVIT